VDGFWPVFVDDVAKGLFPTEVVQASFGGGLLTV